VLIALSPYVDKPLKSAMYGQCNTRLNVTIPAVTVGHRCLFTNTRLFCLVSSGTSCLNLFQPIQFLTSTAASASPSTLSMSHTHTHTQPFNSPLSRTTRVSRYQKGKTNLDFTEARDIEWQWHPLGYMQVCTSLQTDNHTSTPPLSFLQAGCPSCRPTNSVKALKANTRHVT